MKHTKNIFLSIVTVILFTSLQQSNAQYTMLKSVFGNGAVTSSNSVIQMIGTVGQPLIGVNKNSSNNEFIGFWYNKNNITVGVEQLSNKIPEGFRLEQNYPNPVSTSTMFEFTLPKSSHVTFDVYNMLGVKVQTLIDEEMNSGTYQIRWNSIHLPNGLYFYRLQTGDLSKMRKLVVQQE